MALAFLLSCSLYSVSKFQFPIIIILIKAGFVFLTSVTIMDLDKADDVLDNMYEVK